MTDEQFFDDMDCRLGSAVHIMEMCGISPSDNDMADAMYEYIRLRTRSHYGRVTPALIRTVVSKVGGYDAEGN